MLTKPVILLVIAATAGAAVTWAVRRSGVGASPPPAHPVVALAKVAGAERPRFGVEIRHPAGPPTVNSGVIGRDGKPVAVACSTCHTTRPPNVQNKSTEDLDLFHQGLTMKHGGLTCLSCHNSGDYDALRKADGGRVEFADVMSLCAQCHGPQYRDYQHGAHGGMNGYWDLTKGPRTRNNCVNCHDPHSPAYRGGQPAPGPRDRFLTPSHSHAVDPAAPHGGTAHE